MISLSEASPQISITNDLDFFFSVDEDVEGWVQITFDGDSNTGSDAVGLRITPVDSAGNATGPYLLWLFADVAFSGGTIDPLGDTYGRPISLVGGQRYRFANSSRAIVNDGGLARSSYFDTRLSVPEPGGEALMAGIGFLALLATASLKERRMAA